MLETAAYDIREMYNTKDMSKANAIFNAYPGARLIPLNILFLFL